MPKQVHGHRKLEIAWTIAPALLLAVIAVMTVRTIFELDVVPSDNPLEVEVIAHQWWWEIIYPDQNVVTANEMMVPVGRDVNVTLISHDVIHSFWVPKLAGKKDVIPNRKNVIWFNAEEPGVYQGQCAEFCGIAHARMRFQVVALAEEGFQRWVEGQQAPRAVLTGQADEGAQVFAAKGCFFCHTINGPDTDGIREGRLQSFRDGLPITHGPNLTHFASRQTFAAGTRTSTEDNLREWLFDPEAVKPGNRMARLAEAFNDPDFALTPEDISALVAYLRGLE